MNPSSKLVILLPVTMKTLSKKYIKGLKTLRKSPVEKRFIVINKTSDEVIESLKDCLTDNTQSEIEIINRHGSGIFEGFLGVELEAQQAPTLLRILFQILKGFGLTYISVLFRIRLGHIFYCFLVLTENYFK